MSFCHLIRNKRSFSQFFVRILFFKLREKEENVRFSDTNFAHFCEILEIIMMNCQLFFDFSFIFRFSFFKVFLEKLRKYESNLKLLGQALFSLAQIKNWPFRGLGEN